MPAGGRGYTRPPSLISVWSTAPFLLNNAVGRLEMSPSVEARLQSFQDSIEQMLWPEKRDKDSELGEKIPGRIDRTPGPTYLRVAKGYLPDFLQKAPNERLLPKVFNQDGIVIGPIPTGTPIGLLANLNLLSEDTDPARRIAYEAKAAALVVRMLKSLGDLPQNATEAQARETFKDLVDPLLELSKCPDLVVNRGHLFGTTLPDAEKRALIEFLKTF